MKIVTESVSLSESASEYVLPAVFCELALLLRLAAACADGDGVGDDTKVACTSGDGIGDDAVAFIGTPRDCDCGDNDDDCDVEGAGTKLF